MIAFRKKHTILRKRTKAAVCGYPEISIHNGFPGKSTTNYDTHTIGILYAGRNDEDTEDDLVFYAMNAFWEQMSMQLPQVPEGMYWKVAVNTNVEYEDGKDFQSYTCFLGEQTIQVPPRTLILLTAERE